MNDAGTMPPKPLRPTLLQPGDVLLMMGRCQLSKLIAWASDSKYSHAALMLDDGQLVEAALSGSHIAPLAGHLLKFDDYAHIDAFRSVAVCGEADRLALITQAATLVATAYPKNLLPLLGAIMAVRGKVPAHPVARLVTRIALDQLLVDDSERLTCSELVYRAYAQCVVEPAGRLSPRIIAGPQGSRAMPPDFNAWALIKEIHALYRQRAQAVPLLGAGPASKASAGFRRMVQWLRMMRLSDKALRTAQADARRMLEQQEQANGVARHAASASNGMPARQCVRHVNPRTVSPQDLAGSPSLIRLGRLMQHPAATEVPTPVDQTPALV